MRSWLVISNCQTLGLANSLALLVLCILTLGMHVAFPPVPALVLRLLLWTGLALMIAAIFLHVRNDARDLRAKAARRGQ